MSTLPKLSITILITSRSWSFHKLLRNNLLSVAFCHFITHTSVFIRWLRHIILSRSWWIKSLFHLRLPLYCEWLPYLIDWVICSWSWLHLLFFRYISQSLLLTPLMRNHFILRLTLTNFIVSWSRCSFSLSLLLLPTHRHLPPIFSKLFLLTVVPWSWHL
jgi:hypothetical protein